MHLSSLNVYVNYDLSSMAVKSKIVMYANDSSVVSSNKDKFILSDQILNQLHIMNEWFSANGLKLSVDKTQFINFHLNSSKISST